MANLNASSVEVPELTTNVNNNIFKRNMMLHFYQHSVTFFCTEFDEAKYFQPEIFFANIFKSTVLENLFSPAF
ncbi:hypothetical protein BpHYR1_053439 [Brachionus plicatilis]|uniref:Uncharacterized protein n=1 Tax=Brachionus plicatilis TaxID=10195 RepID=A0A3M7QHE6_BRAPC|nr:hypothetical protein BpHYR1_053439 [Brachionus plicatilis]